MFTSFFPPTHTFIYYSIFIPYSFLFFIRAACPAVSPLEQFNILKFNSIKLFIYKILKFQIYISIKLYSSNINLSSIKLYILKLFIFYKTFNSNYIYTSKINYIYFIHLIKLSIQIYSIHHNLIISLLTLNLNLIYIYWS